MDVDLLEHLKDLQKKAFRERRLVTVLTVDVLDAIIERLDDTYEWTTARQAGDGEIWDIAEFAWTHDRAEAVANLKYWYDSGYQEPDEDLVVLIKRPRAFDAGKVDVDRG